MHFLYNKVSLCFNCAILMLLRAAKLRMPAHNSWQGLLWLDELKAEQIYPLAVDHQLNCPASGTCRLRRAREEDSATLSRCRRAETFLDSALTHSCRRAYVTVTCSQQRASPVECRGWKKQTILLNWATCSDG